MSFVQLADVVGRIGSIATAGSKGTIQIVKNTVETDGVTMKSR
jgi:hypothetical protein